MVKINFEKSAKKWLSSYKLDVLNIIEDGLYNYRGRTIAYPHILPTLNRRLNILPIFRDEFWNWFSTSDIPLNQYFHHLNSSQALCFNLFFPFLRENGRGLATLLSSLGIVSAPAVDAMFEFVPDLEENTHFDVMLKLKSESRVYFEIKYTESDFGRAKQDAEHVQKFHTIYAPRVPNRFEDSFCGVSQFLRNYQIMRNVWHMDSDRGDMLIFLYPKANQALCRRESIITSCAREPFRSTIRIVYLEDFLEALAEQLRRSNAENDDWLMQFRQKYLPPRDVTEQVG